MSLLGRLIRRARGLPDATPAIYGPVRTIEQELPYLHEQIRAYASFSPVRVSGNSPLDNYTNETAEIRMAYRAALAEPTVKAALLGKISAVQALGLNVKPAADTPLDHEVADFVKDALNRCAVGTPMLAGIPGIVWEILTAGLIDGYSVCEKVWTRNVRGRFAGKISLQALKAKDSRYIQFELNPFREITAIIPMIANSGVKYDPSDFVLFRYQSLFQNPFGLSDLRSSYRAATMIPAILRLRMMFLDKYTAPFIVTKVNDPALADRMRAEIARARGSGFLVMTAKDEFESVNLAMGGTADFQAGIEDLRKEAAIGISGAFLTIMTGSGGGETRGSSAVQQDTVDLFINVLVQLVNSCLNGQVVPDLVGPNYGDRVEYPTAVLESPNPEQIVNELGIDEALDRLGVPLSLTDLYERSGRRPPKDDADKITKPTGGGLPGMGGDQDFGGPGGPGGDDDNPFGGGDQTDTDVDTNDEDEQDDDDAATFAEPHSRFSGTITDSRGRKRHYVNGRQVSNPAAGKSRSPGRGHPRQPTGLPKNPKKLTIQQAHAALNKMGYTLGKSSYDPATRTQLYSMKFPSGKKGYLSTDEIKKLIYRAPSKAKPAPKPKPAPTSKKPNTDEADHLTHVKTGAHDDAHGEDPYNAVPLHRDAPKARKWALDTAERLGPKLYKKLGLNNAHSGTATLYSALTKAAQRSLSGGSGTLVVKGPNGKTVKITVKHKPRADFAEGGSDGFQVTVSRHHEVATFDEGKWITIGGHKGEGGERAGGSPVFVKDGRIVKGHPTLTGKKLGSLDKPADDTQAKSKSAQSRKDNATSADHSKAVWRKRARTVGHDPDALDALAGDIKAHHDAFADERKELHQYAREFSAKNGFADLRSLGANARHGNLDATKIKGFDQTAEATVNAFPHHFRPETGEHGSHADQLVEMLQGGDPERMSHEEAYTQAFDNLGEPPQRGPKKKKADPDDDFIPFHEVAEFDEPTRHFTGTITDAAGRHRRYVEGRQVAAGKKGSGGKAAPSPFRGGGGRATKGPEGPKPAGAEHAPPQEQVAAEVVAGLPPEFKKTGIIDRVMHFAARAYTSPKLFNAAVKIGTLVHQAAPEIFDTIEDFENPAKAKTSTGQPIGSATGNDPIYAHTGLPGYIALSIAAKVAGVVAGQVAKRWHSTHVEPDDPVCLTLELLAAIRELSGNDAPLPSREEVAAKLEEKRAARGTQQ